MDKNDNVIIFDTHKKTKTEFNHVENIDEYTAESKRMIKLVRSILNCTEHASQLSLKINVLANVLISNFVKIDATKEEIDALMEQLFDNIKRQVKDNN